MIASHLFFTTAFYDSLPARKDLRGISALVLATTILVAMTQLPSAAFLPSVSDKWDEYQRSGTEALDANKYWIAEPQLKRAVTEAGRFGMADLRLARSLGELGRLYTVRGLFAQAEPYMEEQLHVTESALGKGTGETIPAIGTLVKFYLNHGTATKADPLTEELLAIVEGKARQSSQSSGKMVIRKGMPLEGWAGAAAPTIRDPLIEWAITCDTIGNIYRVRGGYALADRLLKASIDLKTMVLGKTHLSLATTYDSLGMVYLAQNDLTEAESYLRDAFVISESILPPEQAEVYARLDKLAKCLIKAGKYKDAEDLYLHSQKFWQKEPSKVGDEPRSLYALGSLYSQQKKFAEAEPVLQQALVLAEQTNGPSSAGLVPYLQQYAYVLYYLGRKDEVDQLRARASTILGVSG